MIFLISILICLSAALEVQREPLLVVPGRQQRRLDHQADAACGTDVQGDVGHLEVAGLDQQLGGSEIVPGDLGAGHLGDGVDRGGVLFGESVGGAVLPDAREARGGAGKRG